MFTNHIPKAEAKINSEYYLYEESNYQSIGDSRPFRKIPQNIIIQRVRVISFTPKLTKLKLLKLETQKTVSLSYSKFKDSYHLEKGKLTNLCNLEYVSEIADKTASEYNEKGIAIVLYKVRQKLGEAFFSYDYSARDKILSEIEKEIETIAEKFFEELRCNVYIYP